MGCPSVHLSVGHAFVKNEVNSYFDQIKTQSPYHPINERNSLGRIVGHMGKNKTSPPLASLAVKNILNL